MDPLSITASALTILGGIIATTSKVKAFRNNYRNADKQNVQIQHQIEHIEVNRALLDSIPSHIKAQLPHLDSCLAGAQAALPASKSIKRKRDRLAWACGRQSKAKAEISSLKETESAVNLTLLLMVRQKL
jgi:chromosome segregation ATPase